MGMALRFVIPGPGPVAWVSKSRAERDAERAARPQVSPERAAEIRHESRHGRWWVLVAIVAVVSLYFFGAIALVWVLPLVLVALLAQTAGNHAERTASPTELAYAQATREINARLPKMGPNGCTACGSTAMHRDADGRKVWPHQFHAAETGRAISARAAEILASR